MPFGAGTYPDFKKFLSRDYFGRTNSSLSCFSAPQGLFRPVRFIPIWLFCSAGIISAGRMHLYLPLFHHKDYFTRPDASLAGSFVPQGLFPPARCIPSLLFFTTGIISVGQIRPYRRKHLCQSIPSTSDFSLTNYVTNLTLSVYKSQRESSFLRFS